MKIFVVGHFGGRNIGDEIILLNQLKLFRDKFGINTEFVIYSYNEKHTLENYKGFNVSTVKAFNLRNSFSSYIDIKNKIKNIDFIILGGGGLIQDVYFSYGIFRYFLPLSLGLKNNVPYYTFSIGAYNIYNKINMKLVTKLVNYANGLSVRDTFSKKVFEKYINNENKVFQIPDSANIVVNNIKLGEEDYIVIVVRDFFSKFLEYILKIVKKIDINFEIIKIVVFEDNDIEKKLAKNIEKLLNENGYIVEIIFDINPSSYLNTIQKSKLIISGRLHGVIPSALLNKKFIALSYSPKISSFCIENGFKFIDIKEIQKVSNDYNQFINKDYKYNQSLEGFEYYLNYIEKTNKDKPFNKIGKLRSIFQLIITNIIGLYLIIIYIVGKISNKQKLGE